MQALLATRVGIEAGVWTVEDAELLAGCGLSGRVTRVMIEPVEVSKLDAVPLVGAIHDVLDRAGVTARRLQHGERADGPQRRQSDPHDHVNDDFAGTPGGQATPLTTVRPL